MSVTAIFSGMVAISRAIPAVRKMFDELNDKWVSYKIGLIDTAHITERNKKDLLNKKIQDATNDEEIKILSSLLHDINNK